MDFRGFDFGRYGWAAALCGACLVALLGCDSSQQGAQKSPSSSSSSKADAQSGPAPTFSLAWSEYPSWSVFGVAHELGLVDGAAGKQGEIEKKHHVDIELKEEPYDTCLNGFASGDVDAVCITNMDAYIVSPSRNCVAVFPTSTSKGADACLVSETIADVDALKGHPVYGLEGTVSQYCFARCLEKLGKNEADYQFKNQDPAVAAASMAQRAEDHQAIMVWNPFVLQTLRNRPDVRVLFDSKLIPGEIVDMVAIGEDSLGKAGSDAFIKAVMETFYAVNRALEEPGKGDEVLVALGKKFSNLGLDDMKLVVQQTLFYKTPEEALAVMEGSDFRQRMELVTDFCESHKLLKQPSSVGYGSDAGVKLRFDASFLRGLSKP